MFKLLQVHWGAIRCQDGISDRIRDLTTRLETYKPVSATVATKPSPEEVQQKKETIVQLQQLEDTLNTGKVLLPKGVQKTITEIQGTLSRMRQALQNDQPIDPKDLETYQKYAQKLIKVVEPIVKEQIALTPVVPLKGSETVPTSEDRLEDYTGWNRKLGKNSAYEREYQKLGEFVEQTRQTVNTLQQNRGIVANQVTELKKQVEIQESQLQTDIKAATDTARKEFLDAAEAYYHKAYSLHPQALQQKLASLQKLREATNWQELQQAYEPIQKDLSKVVANAEKNKMFDIPVYRQLRDTMQSYDALVKNKGTLPPEQIPGFTQKQGELTALKDKLAQSEQQLSTLDTQLKTSQAVLDKAQSRKTEIDVAYQTMHKCKTVGEPQPYNYGGQFQGVILKRDNGEGLFIDKAGKVYLLEKDAQGRFKDPWIDDKGQVYAGASFLTDMTNMNFQQVEASDLPYGFTKDSVTQEIQQLEGYIQQSSDLFVVHSLTSPTGSKQYDLIDAHDQLMKEAIEGMKAALKEKPPNYAKAHDICRQAIEETGKLTQELSRRLDGAVANLEVAKKVCKYVNKGGEYAAVTLGYMKGGERGGAIAGASYKFLSAVAQGKPVGECLLDGLEGATYGMKPLSGGITSGAIQVVRELLKAYQESGGQLTAEDCLKALASGTIEGAVQFLVEMTVDMLLKKAGLEKTVDKDAVREIIAKGLARAKLTKGIGKAIGDQIKSWINSLKDPGKSQEQKLEDLERSLSQIGETVPQ